MEAFAERARGELLATGEKVRKRTVETRDDLTAQERQIVRLGAALPNPRPAVVLSSGADLVGVRDDAGRRV